MGKSLKKLAEAENAGTQERPFSGEGSASELKDQASEEGGKGNSSPNLPARAWFRLQRTIGFEEFPAPGNLIPVEGLSPS